MKEKELYVLVSHLDEDNIHGAKLSFHDISDPHCEAEKYRCYHSGGFSFEITRERSVDESEAGLLGTDKNGTGTTTPTYPKTELAT